MCALEIVCYMEANLGTSTRNRNPTEQDGLDKSNQAVLLNQGSDTSCNICPSFFLNEPLEKVQSKRAFKAKGEVIPRISTLRVEQLGFSFLLKLFFEKSLEAVSSFLLQLFVEKSWVNAFFSKKKGLYGIVFSFR